MPCEQRLTIREGQVLSVWCGRPLNPMSIVEAGQHQSRGCHTTRCHTPLRLQPNLSQGSPEKTPQPRVNSAIP